MNRCKWEESDGFRCGSYALNIKPDGELCDVHYWRAIATQLAEALTGAISSLESNLVYLDAHAETSHLMQGFNRSPTREDAALEGHRQDIEFLRAALSAFNTETEAPR